MRTKSARLCGIAITTLAALGSGRIALGHGAPIVVRQEGSLLVSGGTADPIGFAPTLFVQPGGDGAPLGTFNLPSLGQVLLWDVPGFDISGLDVASRLSLEVVARPFSGSLPIEYRTLWYWNQTASSVGETSSPLHLLGTGQRRAMIDPALGTPPAAFVLADPIGGGQNEGGNQDFHNHGLLSFALDNSPAAASGAYGFFARLISNEYGASAPFLVMLNRGVPSDRMLEAALAINASAFLPGDFNRDDSVDAADYVLWRSGEAAQANYELWRGALGAMVAAGSGASAIQIPEPATILFVGVLLEGLANANRRRARST